MKARYDNLPPHLAPMDERVFNGRLPHSLTMCGVTPDEMSLADYPHFYALVEQTGSRLNACAYVCQHRRNGSLLIRPDFLTLYHQKVRPLREADLNRLKLFGRNNLLTVSLFMRFHQRGFLTTPSRTTRPLTPRA